MNSIYFDKVQIKNGLHTEFINFLIKQSYSDQDDFSYYNDIRIKPDDLGAITVEWESISWDPAWRDGRWEWVDTDHIVAKEVCLPDGTIHLAFPEEEKNVVEAWSKEHN